jgi:hypothetical protein
MQNWHKWVLSIALGFGCGFCTVATVQDSAPWQNPWSYTKGGMIGALPAMAALKMTLENKDGTR